MTEISKNYDFIISEKKWDAFWLEQKIYQWNEQSERANNYVIDTPPPTVSGQLHIGHMYSYAQGDFIARYKRMRGLNVFYPIGFDDNGLPTERLVEKNREVKASKMNRNDFIEICQSVIKDEEAKFRSLFKRIGLSVDWNQEYQTISLQSRKLSQMSFLDLINKGEIYRAKQPMLWDSVDQTALAQADIDDKEKSSTMNEILFRTEAGEVINIMTTRPELLPACVAVFYHPDDVRYKHLHGQFAITPLFGVKIPILADDMVKIDKGTGLVMCCTFGDMMDIEWWKKHKLKTRIIINKNGVIEDISFDSDCLNIEQAKTYADQITNLKIKAAREKILEILRNTELLTKQEPITQIVKCAERSGAPLEILTTPQWFICTLAHKEELLQRANEINWHPSYMKFRLINWINGLAWDWCISRQRFFGVPFPVWYSKRIGEEGKILLPTKEQLPVDPLVDLPLGYERFEVEADLDVMDTWATSSITPGLNSYAISDEYKLEQHRHEQLFPFDLRIQAHDIIRTWAFYTILKSTLHTDTLPWHNIMISGWCLAEDKTKMSKSKNNVIDPNKILDQYGADVMRYWAATFKLGADTSYSEDVMKDGKRLSNKLWNAAKFVSQYFYLISEEDKREDIQSFENIICYDIDKWLLSKIKKLIIEVEQEFEAYEYSNAMNLIEQFFWSVFCDNYLEIVKVRAYNEVSDDKAQYSAIVTLYHSLLILIKLLAPFIPYITEDIYQSFYNNKNSIHGLNNWPKIIDVHFQDNAAIDKMLIIIDEVRKAKTQQQLSMKATIAKIEVSNPKFNDNLITDLLNVTSAKDIEFDSVTDKVIL